MKKKGKQGRTQFVTMLSPATHQSGKRMDKKRGNVKHATVR